MTSDSTCPQTDQLRAALDGTAAPDEQQRIERHLEQCADCRARLEAVADGVAQASHESVTVEAGARQQRSIPATMRQAIADLPTVHTGATALEQIGPYRILQQIGEGGMGVVYKAEQRHPIRRVVALKLIKLGMDTREVIARFEAERQALAMMDHPNVARVHDAGATETGRPYFVMEYVQGEPITAYCDKHKLTVRQRLELFIDVCEAVQHAHTKGIIHRDLKPTNVLVEVEGGKLTPKVIDFGVAKATAQRLTERTLFTETGQLIGTPEYISPEQAEMSALDVDTRSDVYSLGVVLYELLTGALPFDPKTLRQAAFGEIQRIIREEEPPRPSTRLTGLGATGTEIAQRRQTQVATLARELRSELEWIPLKAMRKDRTERYRSASELADDIRSYLQGRPLLAGPESAAYRAKKFLRRHRAAAAVAASIVALIVVASLLYVRGIRIEQRKTEAALVEANRQRDTAERQKSRADRLARFSLSIFEIGKDLDQTKPAAHSLWQMTERAVRRVPEHFADDPEGQSQLQDQLGVLATILYRPDVAAELFAQVLAHRRSSLGEDDPATINAIANYSYALALLDRAAEAEPLHKELLEKRRRLLGDAHPDTIYALHQYGFILKTLGRLHEAEPLLKQALARYRQVLGDDHPDTINAVNSYATVLDKLDRLAEAEPFYREALQRNRRVLGPIDYWTVVSMNNHGYALMRLGRYAEAEPLFNQATTTARRTLGEADFLTLRCWDRRIECLKAIGRDAEASQLQTEVNAVKATTRPAQPP